MNYLTSMEIAEKLGITKRRVNYMCQDGEIEGAYKNGYRWMIPEEYLDEKMGSGNNWPKFFNTTGICLSGKHYMVPLNTKLEETKKLVDENKYFMINRARQFGKSTMLHALDNYLSSQYLVISMDFQMQMSDAKYKSENSFSVAFIKAFANSLSLKTTEGLMELMKNYKDDPNHFELVELFESLSLFCKNSKRPVVLMIDEVDSATNNQVFLDFLAQLRGYYINREKYSTFQSVILAGVCDIKNLKRKLRPDEEHKDNSPWNIATDFNIEMSFSAKQISKMLSEYKKDHNLEFEVNKVAGEIYDYTSGYPYLVSKICEVIDESDGALNWEHQGIAEAVKKIVKESNSLFDDLTKKLRDFTELKNIIKGILFNGKSIPYNLGSEYISIGNMYGFLKEVDGQVAIHNRIFEIWLYNLFIAEEAVNNVTYEAGQSGKINFIKQNELNMRLILNKFVEHFSEIYGNDSDEFIEENGRKLFLLYIRPLINGTGNYYIEARTRSMGRTDIIIDYHGKQYIIEMKIWHGNEYNARGERQLVEYLKDYKASEGYLVSFNFNKNKETGVTEKKIGKYTLVEAVI